VKADKLARQLKKELTRNPKKTIALALVTVVALWFWAPLALKWMGGDAKARAKQAALTAARAAQANPVVDPAAPTEPAAPTAPKIDWAQLLDQIKNDQYMASGTLAADARDPFAATAVEQIAATPTTTTEGSPTVTRPMVIDPTPESVGLTLEGTFVSRRTRKATISGTTYLQGALVEVSTAPASNAGAPPTKDPEAIVYQLISVDSHSVKLSRNGKEYELVLEVEPLSKEEQVSFGAAPVAPAQQ
jgi:hypothetical protein